MGRLVNGVWTVEPPPGNEGTFKKAPSEIRNWVRSGSRFEPEPGRYHLYVSLACPWASRAVLARSLLGLEDVIGLTNVHPDSFDSGWKFEPEDDPVNGFRFLHQAYQANDPLYSGRASVPVLWDRQRHAIVSNDSGDILRMLNDAFRPWSSGSTNLAPHALTKDIDALNARLFQALNNGVYRAGFARDQRSYEEAVGDVFGMLEELDDRLADQRFIFGDALTETDIRLFTTGIRFDSVYYSHFKCNRQHFWDFPNLQGWLLDVYQLPKVAETVDLDQIKRHYYGSQPWINPSGIVPVGPALDLLAAPGRAHVGAPH